MSDSELPFYTQTAILDSYIHKSDPESDPEILEILLEVLRTKPQLRAYFFRNRPNASWATVFWSHGFFESPPQPQKAETGYVLPRWDVQEYLISIADQAPDIVIRHVETIQGHEWYIGQAIRALCYIPVQEALRVIPKIIEWLKDPQIADTIAQQTYDFMLVLAKSQHPTAFSLFQALTAPIPLPEVKGIGGFLPSGGAISKFRRDWVEKQLFAQGLDLLRKLNLQQIVSILEDHLRVAMRIEAQVMNSPDFEFSSGWRTAIADTGQDLDNAYRDRLLLALRDTLEIWVQQDFEEVEPLIERYLTEKHEILRRIGLYLLYRFPAQYQKFVIQELRNTSNLDNVDIHHELFMLLQNGYPYLEVEDQKKLIAQICAGPDLEDAQRLAEWAQQQYGEDPDKYIERHSKNWILDRLWMLKAYLVDQPKKILDELIDEFGEPEHPAFTRWSTGPFWIQEVGPITEQEVSQMTPGELIDFIKQWQPEPRQEFGPTQISHKGMANVVASVIIANPQKYSHYIVSIALQRPEFAYALLHRPTESEQVNFLPWELSIDLCEKLLASEIVRNNMRQASDDNWVNVRQSIVRLLQVGLNNTQKTIPTEYLPKVRDILLILVDDPDPTPEYDRPSEGWFGYNDPITVAVNHIRPSALFALIEYARNKAKVEHEAEQNVLSTEPGPRRLEPIILETLTRKLNRDEDPSWAVHSVYGAYLPLLYWLDKNWVAQHVDLIFPQGRDEESFRFFIAAWDSFVTHNRKFYPDLLTLLREKYLQAIDNLSKGYTTKTHLQPERGLANHVIMEYLLADYDLLSAEGQQSLIVRFFRQLHPEVRDTAVWILWRLCQDHSQRDIYWSRIRSLWEWRVSEALASNHSTDFDAEMRWFAQLPLEAPNSETISSLWPLLEGIIPHITRSEYRDIGWDAMEKYLAREVEQQSLKAIQLYRLLHEQTVIPHSFYPGEESRKIIEIAAADPHSRYEALALINSLARLGYHQYQDIYDRYAG